MSVLLIEIRFMLIRLWCMVVGHGWLLHVHPLADIHWCPRCKLRYRTVWGGSPGRRAWRWWR